MPKQRSGQELVKTRRACEKLPLAGVRLGGWEWDCQGFKEEALSGLSEGEEVGRSGSSVCRAAGSSLKLGSGTAESSRAFDQRPHSFYGATSR